MDRIGRLVVLIEGPDGLIGSLEGALSVAASGSVS